ncbi:hypothetical protein BDV23DRAFT_92570 [Aspergillus alliaceus]|uniref:Uncharacterized protein n=1 Tax=Petromyces alliaceus TaxID=209559 RepID=A0A5N7C863_PETAA|nr:uncharacterized protein BDW43DRAFT_163161 [Aspergillus alliaceus]KAB8230434.1 hypothetical protein BDW43DRAFT_163161 [Aspergillus alliaceus]KAE8389773.1 hypothetical protein BDV23DRAFT_92570 [Aspergillus alliaceus]
MVKTSIPSGLLSGIICSYVYIYYYNVVMPLPFGCLERHRFRVKLTGLINDSCQCIPCVSGRAPFTDRAFPIQCERVYRKLGEVLLSLSLSLLINASLPLRQRRQDRLPNPSETEQIKKKKKEINIKTKIK